MLTSDLHRETDRAGRAAGSLALSAAPGPALPAPIEAEIVGIDAIDTLLPDWRNLYGHALEANLFLLPDYAAAWLSELDGGRAHRIGLAWRIEGTTRRLIGLWPFRPNSRRFALPLPMAESMTRIYAPLSTPLLDKHFALEAAKALLSGLRRPGGQRLALFEFMIEDGAVADLLRQAMTELGLRNEAMRPRERAIALPRGENYITATMGAKKRRNLASLAKQLAAEGNVRFDIAETPDAVEAAMEDFLRLEQGGWKGMRAGTASLQRPDRAAFMRAVARRLSQHRAMRIHCLRLDDSVIAVGLTIVDGRRAAFWKTAYDERYARFSPGTQIALAVTRDLTELPGLERADSLADPDHPLMMHLWRERMIVSDWLVDLTPGGSPVFTFARALEQGRQALRRHRRRLLIALKRRR